MTTFEDHRSYLFAIAYRMLGSVMDAEDIVQDAWMRYQQRDNAPDNPRAYLNKITVNLCLDYLKSARIQRENYIGEWLPEPVLTAPNTPFEALNTADNISIAFMMLLERLSSLERAVFILREVFEYDYADIAQVLNRSESSCRQLFSRAKKHIQANRPRFEAHPDEHQQLVTQFITAIEQGNITHITDLLAEDVTLISDGGGKVSAALHPILGRDKVLRFLLSLTKRTIDTGINFVIEPVQLNGQTSILIRNQATQEIMSAVIADANQGQITTMRFIRNPDKFSYL